MGILGAKCHTRIRERFFLTDHPEPRVKNPWVNGYPQVFSTTDLHGYSQVYPRVFILRNRNKHIFRVQILQEIGTTMVSRSESNCIACELKCPFLSMTWIHMAVMTSSNFRHLLTSYTILFSIPSSFNSVKCYKFASKST